MFLSGEIDIKLCKIYTKIHIYAILYKGCSIKIIFNKYVRNQSENEDISFSLNPTISIQNCMYT